MTDRRKWITWPSRFLETFNGSAGFSGLAGATLSGAGLTVFEGLSGDILAWIGALLLIGTVLFVTFKSMPPKLTAIEDLTGERLAVEDLSNVSSPVLKIGIIGPSSTGKTTLKSRLFNKKREVHRTQQIDSFVLALNKAPLEFVAIIDGSGERYHQQFSIVENSDIIFIVLDHNPSDSANELQVERIEGQSVFLRQIRDFLSDQENRQLEWVHFVMNKKDLWSSLEESDISKLKNFFEKEVGIWRNGNWAKKVSYCYHSNEFPADIAHILSELHDYYSTKKN